MRKAVLIGGAIIFALAVLTSPIVQVTDNGAVLRPNAAAELRNVTHAPTAFVRGFAVLGAVALLSLAFPRDES